MALALQTLATEADSVSALKKRLGRPFLDTLKLIYRSRGRVVVTGIGKSAIVAQKIVSTLNSTGTPAIFMHAADAVHGDLGILQRHDVVVCLSNSGNTPEIKVLVPFIRSAGNKLVAISGRPDSFLSRHADLVLDAGVAREACPMNLAPTSSSMAQLALGDTLAVCLLACRGFSSKDFARFHPGGALGKRLYLKVSDIYPHNSCPAVTAGEPLKDVIYKISAGRLGAVAVVRGKKLSGIITDGDLRRMLAAGKPLDGYTAGDIMTRRPRTAGKDMLAADALAMMKASNITQLVITEQGRLLGFVHLHDLLREGIL
jgi:arabinose-5-phosphate isomerase